MLQKNFLRKLSEWVSMQVLQNEIAREKASKDFGFYSVSIQDPDDYIKLTGLFSEWLVFDYRQKIFDNLTGLEYFVKHNPLNLSVDELLGYKDLLGYEVGLFEVVDIETGRGVVLKSIFNGEENFVHDITTSMSVKKGNTVWTRIVSVRDVYNMVGSTLFAAPIRIMQGMRESFAELGKNSFDARWAMFEFLDKREKRDEKIEKFLDDENSTLEELEEKFKVALKKCGMENFFSIETFKEWNTNKRKYKINFAIRALNFLMPIDTKEKDAKSLVIAAANFANNLPRKSLKGRTPNETRLSIKRDEGVQLEMDIFSRDKYNEKLEKASEYMAEGDFKLSFKAFEGVMRDLLNDKVPLFDSFKIYANSAVCCFHMGEEALGEELLNAALRINPFYDFAERCKKRYPAIQDVDISDVPKKEKKIFESLRDMLKKRGREQYQRKVFSKYEKFLEKIGVSLAYKTKTIPTNYYFNEDGSKKTMSKISRNDPCYCGSGKKFKKCCGK